EWASLSNAIVDATLLNALDHPSSYLKVISPEAVYVDPYPMLLICRSCHVLSYRRPRQSDEDKIKSAYKNIRTINGVPRIKCTRPGCNGHMVQMKYFSVHRCGYMGNLDIPWAASKIQNLGYNDKGSTFIQNKFFDVDTGEQTDHALQGKCKQCTSSYSGADGNGRRASSVTLRDKFYPKNIQYLCLSSDMGKLISGASNIIGPPGDSMTGTAKDISQGVISVLIGVSQPEDFIQHLKKILTKDLEGNESVAEIIRTLEKERFHKEQMLELFAGKNLSEDMIKSVTKAVDKTIKDLEDKLALAQGLFSNISKYGFVDDQLIQNIGARRRSMESALLLYDSRNDRLTIDEIINSELDLVRKDQFVYDFSEIRSGYGVLDIIHYKEINVVLASIGYTRELSQPNSEAGSEQVPVVLMGYEDRYNESLKGKRILYAMPAKTEAIQVRLDPCKVLQWCVEQAGWDMPSTEVMSDKALALSHLLINSPALSLDPAEVMIETKNRPLKESAPFHLLHTISHCLLGTIKPHTGYDEKSVMEYLLPMDLSIVLYVTSVQNYTAGGLLTLFQHYCLDWFEDASNYAFNCIFDPICSDKGSTCSGCVQIVIGCETFNHGLSRSYIHGGEFENGKTIKKGFWSN
ncbi:MAG: hypothetical protein ABGY08_02615, partial [Gammaproteobacteria bacterium]